MANNLVVVSLVIGQTRQFPDPCREPTTDGLCRWMPESTITRPFVLRPTGAVDLLGVRFEAHGAYGLHTDMS